MTSNNSDIFIKSNVIVITPFRNTSHNIARYFDECKELAQNYTLQIIALEGDSKDNTRELIHNYSSEDTGLKSPSHPTIIVDVTHNSPIKWASVEDPRRLEMMSNIMNVGLDTAKEIIVSSIRSKIENFDLDNTFIVWVMSDLEGWAKVAANLIELIKDNLHLDILAPVTLTPGGRFYDTWGYRAGGNRFTPETMEEINRLGRCLLPLDSAGSMLVFKATICLDESIRAIDLEAVSWCNKAREKGYNIYMDTKSQIIHKDSKRKRVLFVGDILCPTGFARITHNILPHLSEHFDIDVVGTNYYGAPHNLPYSIWPFNLMPGSELGERVIAQLIVNAYARNEPYDVLLILADVFDLPALAEYLLESLETEVFNSTKLVGWTGADGVNYIGYEFDRYYKIICWTEHTKQEIKKSTVSLFLEDKLSVVPLGVDTGLYYPDRPADREEFLRTILQKEYEPEGISLFIPEFIKLSNAFIFGFVGTNQHRKRIDLLLKSYSIFCKSIPENNSILIIHASKSSKRKSFDIERLADYYGIFHRVFVINSVLSQDTMRKLYSSFDLFVSTTQGEGWGLPLLEAMACKVPVLTVRHSGFASWIEESNDATLKTYSSVETIEEIAAVPANNRASVLHGICNTNDFADAMKAHYLRREYLSSLDERSYLFASESRFNWKNIASKIKNILLHTIG